jgi:hypothetical protein
MTDGVHAVSLSIGDPGFLKHKEIVRDMEDRWQCRANQMPTVSAETESLARKMGYLLPDVIRPMELTPQQRLLVRHFGDPPRWAIAQRIALRVDKPLDRAAFSESWRSVLNAHLSCRRGFFQAGGELQARSPAGDVEIALDHVDARGMEEAERTTLITTKMRAYDDALALEHPPLLRIGLATLGDLDYELFWVVHHLIADGISLRVLVQKVMDHYGSGVLVPEPPEGTLTAYLEEVSKIDSGTLSDHAAYWHQAVQAAPMTIPCDGTKKGPSLYGHEREVIFRFVLGRANQGKTVPGQTLFEATAVALYETVAAWAGTDRPVIVHRHNGRGLGRAGRFAETVANLALDFPLAWPTVKKHLSKADKVKLFRRLWKDIPLRGSTYPMLVLDGALPEAGIVSPVRLNFQTDPELVGAGYQARWLESFTLQPASLQRPYALDCIVRTDGGQVEFRIRYAKDRHNEGSMEAFAQLWAKAVRTVIRYR